MGPKESTKKLQTYASIIIKKKNRLISDLKFSIVLMTKPFTIRKSSSRNNDYKHEKDSFEIKVTIFIIQFQKPKSEK